MAIYKAVLCFALLIIALLASVTGIDTPRHRTRADSTISARSLVYGGLAPKMKGTAASRCDQTIVPATKPCCRIFPEFGGQPLALNCAEGSECVRKNGFYGACLTPERKQDNLKNHGWEGTVVKCGQHMLIGCPDTSCRGSRR